MPSSPIIPFHQKRKTDKKVLKGMVNLYSTWKNYRKSRRQIIRGRELKQNPSGNVKIIESYDTVVSPIKMIHSTYIETRKYYYMLTFDWEQEINIH